MFYIFFYRTQRINSKKNPKMKKREMIYLLLIKLVNVRSIVHLLKVLKQSKLKLIDD